MNLFGVILISGAIVLFTILINYRFWEDGRFAILKTTSMLVIIFGLLTFGSVCTNLLDYNKLGFIWTVFGSSVTIIALGWSLSTQLTISDELEKLRTEYLRLNNNHCIDTSRFVKDLLTRKDCTSSDIILAFKSVRLIKNIIDSSGNKTNASNKTD